MYLDAYLCSSVDHCELKQFVSDPWCTQQQYIFVHQCLLHWLGGGTSARWGSRVTIPQHALADEIHIWWHFIWCRHFQPPDSRCRRKPQSGSASHRLRGPNRQEEISTSQTEHNPAAFTSWKPAEEVTAFVVTVKPRLARLLNSPMTQRQKQAAAMTLACSRRLQINAMQKDRGQAPQAENWFNYMQMKDRWRNCRHSKLLYY